MPIDREAFTRIVSEKSPLSPQQIDRMFGPDGVTAETKATAWQFLQLSQANQFRVWQVFTAFPDAKLERVK